MKNTHLWVFYSAKDNICIIHTIKEAIKPNQTKIWRQLRQSLAGTNTEVGYVKNELFQEKVGQWYGVVKQNTKLYEAHPIK